MVDCGRCDATVEFATTRSELNYVFDIIDNTHSGEITYKQFINVLHYDRPAKVSLVTAIYLPPAVSCRAHALSFPQPRRVLGLYTHTHTHTHMHTHVRDRC